MKTRVLHTDIYEKLVKWDAPQEVRRLYPYLLTNKRINISGIYELPDQYIYFETLLSAKEFQSAKEWLKERKKVRFHNGWIHVLKVDDYNNYKKSDLNIIAYDKEIALVPPVIREYFFNPDRDIDTSIDTTIDTASNKKQVISNPIKGEIAKRGLDEIDDEYMAHVAEKYQVPISFVISKLDDLTNWIKEKPTRARGRDLRITLMAWVKKDALERRENVKSKITYVGDTE